MVIAAAAVGAWLGLRDFASMVASDANASAEVAPATQRSAEKPSPKRRSVRTKVAVRSAAQRENTIGATLPEAETEAAIEASVSAAGPVSQRADLTETEAAPIEVVSEAVAAAPVAVAPEDNYVYSSNGAGVFAPTLVSLGFAQRVVGGFRTRTTTLELVISKSGTVERAKIFSPSRNWEDAMLLSRAKTLQFVPAQRNGIPVRYRFLLKVDTSP